MEQEVAYPIRKRLREEVAELEEELKGKEVSMFELAAQNDWLQSELIKTKEKLAAEEASVDELLEFKYSTCLEATAPADVP